MVSFNIEHYSSYYSYDDLINKIQKYNIDIVNSDIDSIFKDAIKFSIVDLVEYSYKTRFLF